MSKPTVKVSDKVHDYLAAIGRRGGHASQRDLSHKQAQKMVAIREAKRAAIKKGVNPLTIPRRPLNMQGDEKRPGRRLPTIQKRSFPAYARYPKPAS
jgi:hypothetical protein